MNVTARYAPVASSHILWELYEAKVLGGYHLWLAHDVLDFPGEWQLLAKYVRQLADPFIIMDNSLIELGRSVGAADLLGAARLVRASCVVLPDKLLDGPATVEMSVDAAMSIRRTRLYAEPPNIMAVVQGSTPQEVSKCVDDLITQVKPNYLALPRVLTDNGMSRAKIAYDIDKFGIKTHLLGFSDDLRDDFWALRVGCITGIDSAMPIWYGLNGGILPDTPPGSKVFNSGHRPTDYLGLKTINETVIQNILTVNTWAGSKEY